MEYLLQRFGNLVAAHRKAAKLTRKQLHKKSNIGVSMIARIEKGATGVRFHSIMRLAEALNCDPAEFFTDRLPHGAMDRPKLTAITTRLAKLDDDELDWIDAVIRLVMKEK